jgi:myo-inositol-1(or 4)-monophosphatase
VSDEAGLLELAVEAARLAGSLLAERAARGAERSVASKSTPTDLVSEADLAAQRAIRELICKRRPGDAFLGEEEEEEGLEEEEEWEWEEEEEEEDEREEGEREKERERAEGDGPPGSGLQWIVDPLDGTVNFLFGIPQWCVSVAVADQQGTLAGAVYDPSREELFTATRSGEALMRSAAGTSQLRGRALDPSTDEAAEAGGLATAMVATGLAYDARVRSSQAEVLAGLIPRVRDIRRFGSAALDLCWTAAGRYDAYYERSVKAWDIAAGELICRRSGLEILELAETAALPSGILAARPAIAGQLYEIVA